MASNVQDCVTLGKKGIELAVIKGDLFKEQADVLVCSSTKTLDLSRGRASKSLVAAAGPGIQKECRKRYPQGIDYKEIAVVGAGNLHCKNVYLVALPVWASGHQEKEVLDNILTQCLETADAQEHRLMVLPALGCGLLRYPPDEAAGAIMDSIKNFSNDHPYTTVQRVTIVVYHTDNEVYQAFMTRVHTDPDDTDDDQMVNGAMSADNSNDDPPPRMASKNIGIDSIFSERAIGRMNSVEEFSILIKVGDIALSKADVIVCPTTTNLDLESSSISISFLTNAGFQIQSDLTNSYPNGLRAGQVAVTEGHRLNCRSIFYVVSPNWEKEYKSKKDLYKCVSNCLQTAMQEGLKSIVLPALGVDERQSTAEVVAKTMMKCIMNHRTEHVNTSISNVTIVVDSRLKNCQGVKKIFESELAERQSPEEEEEEDDQYFSLDPFTAKRMEDAMKKAIERSQPRGSSEWYKLMYTSDLKAPSNWTGFRGNKTLKEWLSDDVAPKLEKVDNATLEAIRRVIENTWITKNVGQGKDASGLGDLKYKTIHVTNVERIENCELFEKYAQKRQEFFHKRAKRGACTEIKSVAGSSGPLLTEKHIPEESPLTVDIYPEINEHYLLHGTKNDKVSIILKQGLDSRLSDASGMFGPGIYMAESSTKSDQYADDKHHRSLGIKKMLLVRACLGEVVIQKNAKSFARAPCCSCGEDKCSCNTNSFYGAVVGDGTWIFREFVVYDRQQVYPEYVVTYRRA